MFKMRPGDWLCNICDNHNFAKRSVCNRPDCGGQRDDARLQKEASSESVIHQHDEEPPIQPVNTLGVNLNMLLGMGEQKDDSSTKRLTEEKIIDSSKRSSKDGDDAARSKGLSLTISIGSLKS